MPDNRLIHCWPNYHQIAQLNPAVFFSGIHWVSQRQKKLEIMKHEKAETSEDMIEWKLSITQAPYRVWRTIPVPGIPGTGRHDLLPDVILFVAVHREIWGSAHLWRLWQKLWTWSWRKIYLMETFAFISTPYLTPSPHPDISIPSNYTHLQQMIKA